MNRHTDLASIETQARRRVGIKMGLYLHMLVYSLVNLGLFALQEINGDGRGPHLPLMGWGLGLAIHAAVVIVRLASDGWRGRMVEREMERLGRRG